MSMSVNRACLLLALVIFLVTALPSIASAQEESEEERFERVIGEALRAYNEGDYDAALDFYFEAKVLKDLAEIDYSIARSYHNKSKCASAEKFYDKALSRIDELPEAYEAKINEHMATLSECVEAEDPKEPDPVVVQPTPLPIDPTPPPVEEKPTDWLSIGLMAGGGAVIIAGLGVDLGSAGLIDEYEEWKTDTTKGTNDQRRAKVDELEGDIQTRKIVSIVLYGVGGAALVTGTVLFFVRMDSGDEEDSVSWTLDPAVNQDGAGMVFTTRF